MLWHHKFDKFVHKQHRIANASYFIPSHTHPSVCPDLRIKRGMRARTINHKESCRSYKVARTPLVSWHFRGHPLRHLNVLMFTKLSAYVLYVSYIYINYDPEEFAHFDVGCARLFFRHLIYRFSFLSAFFLTLLCFTRSRNGRTGTLHHPERIM